MKQISIFVLASTIAMAGAPAPSNTESLWKAIRAGDPAAVRASIAAGANPNAKDNEGTPAVMYAALVADAATMRVLLDKGADPNGLNPAGATALIYAAGDPAKAKLLMARGAKVQVQSGAGATPLFVASSYDGNAEIVRLMLAKGARTDLRDQIEGIPVLPSGGGKTPPLVAAARLRNPDTLRALLAAGADVNAADSNGATALSDAILYNNPESVRMLLAAGAKVNFPITVLKQTPLMYAAMRGNSKVVRMLLDAGADVNATDATGSTPLMWAAHSEYGDAAAGALLLAAGAEINHVNKPGESAMTWAKRRGETELVAHLRKAGAREEGPAATGVPFRPTANTGVASNRAAAEKGLPVLQSLGGPSFKKTGCVSCHNNLMPMMAAATARDRGYHYDAELLGKNAKLLEAFTGPAAEPMREGLDLVPDIPISGGYVILGFNAAGVAPNAVTDAIVHRMVQQQSEDGSWPVWAPRPPIECSDFTATALAVRSMVLYGPQGRRAEFAQRIENARKWLEAATPRTGEERNMRLLGLTWAHAKPEVIRSAAASIVAAQREDGGWAQLDTLQSDAYGTGETLFALHEAGSEVGSAAYRRGVAWLRQTQEPDGSWHVKTRSYPFQPLTDTGYGHGRDQWISSQAASWAVMALMFANEEPSSIAQVVRAGN